MSQNRKPLSNDLATALRNAGMLSEKPFTFDRQNVELLRGIEGATELIEAIENYGEIQVWEQSRGEHGG